MYTYILVCKLEISSPQNQVTFVVLLYVFYYMCWPDDDEEAETCRLIKHFKT